jgi:two-component system chemotaxis response regulator CheB
MSGRIVVISSDFTFRVSVADALRSGTQLGVAVAADVFQGAGMVQHGAANVLVLDTETLRVSDAYAKSLMSPGSVMVVAVGKTNAANFMREGIPCILSKPLPNNKFSLNIFINELRANMEPFLRAAVQTGKTAASSMLSDGVTARQKVIAIAASTGGTEALPVVMRQLPANSPPVLIVQHMPPVFTAQFAERLDKLSAVTVKEATTGDLLRKGLALLAPGDFHMKLVRKGGFLSVENVISEKVHAVRPSADVTFDSMGPIIGGNCIGVILTGMGADGAAGLKRLHDKGAVVIGQDESSCIVYGMPKAAYEMGAVDYQLPLDKIGHALREFME